MTQEKGVIVTNDQQNLVSANLGPTAQKGTNNARNGTNNARTVSHNARTVFIAKNAHMVTNNAQKNLVRI